MVARKGIPISEEQKRKISDSLKGRRNSQNTEFKKGSSGFKGKHSEESKEKMRETAKKQIENGTRKMPHKKGWIGMCGEKSPNWKGGISPLNKRLRASSMWKIWREGVFLRDNFTCQNPNCEYCHNKIGVILHPHHIQSFAEYPELRFNINNGITYCAEFHINSKLLHKNILKEIN